MNAFSDPFKKDVFRPMVVGALYTGIERGLSADILATRGLGGKAYPVCTSIVAAGIKQVKEILEVPADSVDAQLESVLSSGLVNAAKIGVLGAPATVELLFRRLEQAHPGPVVLDVTLSGPLGEDVAGDRTTDRIKDVLDRPDLVSLRKVDAELLTRMEINSLDDAAVAVQRMNKLGARRVLLRCGVLPARFTDRPNGHAVFVNDLFYDGDEFSLFEAPLIEQVRTNGSSSALLLALLQLLYRGSLFVEAIQGAKLYVTEALRRNVHTAISDSPHYFWNDVDEDPQGDSGTDR